MSGSFHSLKSLVSTLGLWVLIALSVALLVSVLPIPDSPFFAGASIAIIYSVMKKYAGRDDD
jgi:hypothetical protein